MNFRQEGHAINFTVKFWMMAFLLAKLSKKRQTNFFFPVHNVNLVLMRLRCDDHATRMLHV